jgi:signal transduction histidine kinase
MTHQVLSRANHHLWARQIPLFWKMLGADVVLVGVTATLFPAQTGVRLLLMVVGLVLASLVLNYALTPPVTPRTDAGAAPLRAASLHSPLRRSLHAHEAERMQIAEELRENCAQHLAALRMQLAAVAATTSDEQVTAMLAPAVDLATQLATDVAGLAERIAPAWRGEFGLVHALDGLQRRMSVAGVFDVGVVVHGEPVPLSLPLTRALLRVAEEAVGNARRHANTESVRVGLYYEPAIVRVEVVDDAAGFDLAALDDDHPGLGLFRARELLAHEGGSMQIESAPGAGTRVVATASPDREVAP